MKILPINLIWSEDRFEVGEEIADLAWMAQQGVPVADSLVIWPNQELFSDLVKKWPIHEMERLEAGHTGFRQQWLNLEIPLEISTHIDPKLQQQIWQKLLERWFDQLWKGLSKGQGGDWFKLLKPQQVVMASQVTGQGVAYYHPNQKVWEFRVQNGVIEPFHQADLEKHLEIIRVKKLLPVKFHWMIDRDIKLVQLSSLELDFSKPEHHVDLPVTKNDKALPPVVATKTWLEISDNWQLDQLADGILFRIESNKKLETIEDKLLEAAKLHPRIRVIVEIESGHTVSKDQFEKIVELIKFAKHKNSLGNIDVAVRGLRSSLDLAKFKQELATHKLHRGPNFKLWLVAGIAENILNLEHYLSVGIDGVILELDDLDAAISGYQIGSDLYEIYRHDQTALQQLLTPIWQMLHRTNLPIIASGRSVLDNWLLNWLLKQGLYGVMTKYPDFEAMRQSLHHLEKKLVQAK